MNSPEIQLVTQLTFIHNEFERYMRESMKSARLDITHVRFGILHQIKETGSLNQQALADWNNISPQAVHRHLRVLEEKGYLVKKDNKEDGRSHIILLTQSGESLITKSQQILVSAVKDFFKPLEEEEIFLIIKLLSKVKAFDTTLYCK